MDEALLLDLWLTFVETVDLQSSASYLGIEDRQSSEGVLTGIEDFY